MLHENNSKKEINNMNRMIKLNLKPIKEVKHKENEKNGRPV